MFTNMNKLTLVSAAALLGASLASATAAEFDITLNTAGLVGSLNGPFSLDFQLNDGSGGGSGSNSANIRNFNFGAGSAVGSPTLINGATGSLTSSIALTETAAYNEAYQGFTPGATLSFHVSLTDNAPSTSTPDIFSFAILDQNLNNLPATGVGDSIVTITIDPTGAIVATGYTLGSEHVTVTSVVPEPASTGAVVAGLAGLMALVRVIRVRRDRR